MLLAFLLTFCKLAMLPIYGAKNCLRIRNKDMKNEPQCKRVNGNSANLLLNNGCPPYDKFNVYRYVWLFGRLRLCLLGLKCCLRSFLFGVCVLAQCCLLAQCLKNGALLAHAYYNGEYHSCAMCAPFVDWQNK